MVSGFCCHVIAEIYMIKNEDITKRPDDQYFQARSHITPISKVLDIFSCIIIDWVRLSLKEISLLYCIAQASSINISYCMCVDIVCIVLYCIVVLYCLCSEGGKYIVYVLEQQKSISLMPVIGQVCPSVGRFLRSYLTIPKVILGSYSHPKWVKRSKTVFLTFS